MRALSEIFLTFQRELLRTLRSGKGLAGLALFLLGGSGVAIVLFSALDRARYYEGRAATREAIRRQALEAMYEGVAGRDEIVSHLLGAPEPLLAFYPLTTFFLAILTMVWGFDTIAADVQHRTIRFVTLRASRPSLVVGRWLALWVSGALVTLVVSALLWAGLCAKGPFETSAVLVHGARTWLAAITLSLWYSALTVLASTMYRTPVLALLTAGGVGTGLFFLRHLSGARWAPTWLQSAHHALPGAWDDRLLGPAFSLWGAGTGVCLLWATAAIVAASVLLSRRDV
jgi:ABC-type transport system involved in multi-copper enzyme maturation permease subunit